MRAVTEELPLVPSAGPPLTPPRPSLPRPSLPPPSDALLSAAYAQWSALHGRGPARDASELLQRLARFQVGRGTREGGVIGGRGIDAPPAHSPIQSKHYTRGGVARPSP